MSRSNIVAIFHVYIICAIITSVFSNPCDDHQYGVRLDNGDITCKDCYGRAKCPFGQGVSFYIECGTIIPAGTHSRCESCSLGKTYSTSFDAKPCRDCTTCHPNEAFDGYCIKRKDTIKCKGVCKKGYYAVNNTISNCTPCSKCQWKNQLRIKKCIDDGMPLEKQCENASIILSTVITKNVSYHGPNIRPTSQVFHSKNNSNQFIDEDTICNALCITGWVIVCILLFFVAYYVVYPKCKQGCRNTNSAMTVWYCQAEGLTTSDEELTEIAIDLRETTTEELPSKADVGTNTDFDHDKNADKKTLRRRSNSFAGLSGLRSRKVSSAGQTSPIPESDIEGDKFDSNKASNNNLSATRRLSSGKIGNPFKRQLSNPDSQQKKKGENPVRRSSTISNFKDLVTKPEKNSGERRELLNDTDGQESDDDAFYFTPKAEDQKIPEEPETKNTAGKKIGDINGEVYRQLTRALDMEIDGKDLWTLGGTYMGYTIDLLKQFKTNVSPSDSLLTAWGVKSGNDLAKLREFLEDLGRDDAIEILKNE